MLQARDVVNLQVPGDAVRLADPKLIGHNSHGLQFSPDGKYLASCRSGSILLWDVAGRKVERQFPLPEGVLSLRFTPKGDVLAAGCGDSKIRLLKVADGKPLDTLEIPGKRAYGIRSLAMSPDGKTLVACDFELIFWNLATRKFSLWPIAVKDRIDLVGDQVHSVAYSPDGKQVITALGVKRLFFWEVKERKVISRCVHEKGGAECLEYIPDGKLLASGDSEGYVCLWDTANYSAVASVRATKGNVNSLCCSPDGKYLVAAGNDGPGGPGYVTIWNLATGKHAAMPFAVQQKEVLSIALSPDGKWLAAGGVDKEICLLDFPKIVGARKEGQK